MFLLPGIPRWRGMADPGTWKSEHLQCSLHSGLRSAGPVAPWCQSDEGLVFSWANWSKAQSCCEERGEPHCHLHSTHTKCVASYELKDLLLLMHSPTQRHLSPLLTMPIS